MEARAKVTVIGILNSTYERTYHMAITVILALASIITTIFRGQNYIHLALFLLNHLPNMNRSHLNQNYETLHIENIITYMTYNRPPSNFHQISNFKGCHY